MNSDESRFPIGQVCCLAKPHVRKVHVTKHFSSLGIISDPTSIFNVARENANCHDVATRPSDSDSGVATYDYGSQRLERPMAVSHPGIFPRCVLTLDMDSTIPPSKLHELASPMASRLFTNFPATPISHLRILT